MNCEERRIKVLIVDDEALARRLVREYLGTHPDVDIVGECEQGLDAVRDIAEMHPDLVFLDIQMPKLTGLEVLELTGRRTGVIFTTAYDQHALKAFDLHAVDYLLKPFSQARFDQALTKARRNLGAQAPALRQLMADAATRLTRILVRDRHQVHVLALEQVAYVQAQDDYVSIRSAGRDYLKTQALSELAAQLDPQQFVRVHRSYLLNLAHLQKLERSGKDRHVAITHCGQPIPISRAGYDRLIAIIAER
ncbi:MAG: response regulator [Betaproteobacteria bacterium]